MWTMNNISISFSRISKFLEKNYQDDYFFTDITV